LLDLWGSIQRERVVQGWPTDLRWALVTDRPMDDLDALGRTQGLLSIYRDDLPNSVVPLALAPLGAAWALMAHRKTGAGLIPLVIVTQIVLYVALDGSLFRYRFPLQPLITLLGAAGLALVIQQLAVVWRVARGAATDEVGPVAPAEAA
jgi:hypothetical protein